MRIHSPALLSACLLPAAVTGAPAAADDFAVEVISYAPGSNATPGYTDPLVALGPPERFSGEGIFPGVVSVFNPAWRPDEIVSVGAGGHLVLRFDPPVTDDPNNLFGIDLLVFGNAAFIDDDWPNGACGTPCTLLGDGGSIEVSADSETWVEVPGIDADGLFPTQGYLDVPPYAESPGRVPSDFTRPVDPRLTLADLDALPHEAVRMLYGGSGGGAGIDLAPTGLATIAYVRISAPVGSLDAPEVDAVADVAPRTPGDVNLDGIVDVTDLLALLAAWGPNDPGEPPADFDGSGTVDILDLLALLANWTG